MGLILFSLFGLSFFISKSAFTLFYTLAVIFSLYDYDWKSIKSASVLEKSMMSLFPLAIVFGLFSSGQGKTAIDVLSAWTWPLIFFPIVFLYKNNAIRISFYKSLAMSLLIACLYSYYRFYNEYGFIYNTSGRVSSFWDILRWSYFCGTAVTILFSVIVKKDFLDLKTRNMLFVLLGLSVASLILTNSRGAWLGSLFGVLISIVVQKKSLKYYVLYITSVCLLLMTSNGVRARIFSSFNVQKNGTLITSQNNSNAGRLHMWKVALDLYQQVPFFGVGFKNSKPELEKFLATQDADYIQKYTKIDYSYTDQHSSYIALLLQFGGLYSLILYFLFFTVTWLSRKDSILMPAMFCTYFVYLFYGCIVSFEAVVGFGLISFMILNIKQNNLELSAKK